MSFVSKIAVWKKANPSLPKGRLRSQQCTQAQLQSDVFQDWVKRIHERPLHMHRKVWEYCYIAQVLYERGMLVPNRRGLGFAVGQEPLPALFASLGCDIMATDLATEEAQKGGWVESAQHANSLEVLNRRQICDAALFSKKVSFRHLDMRTLPDDLGLYDFIWSSCSLEHLGSMDQGEQFIYDSLKYLKPGGVGVHTTEFNLQSNLVTVVKGPSVIYRKRDLERIAENLQRRGYRIDLDFSGGDLPYDQIVEEPPYTHEIHLKLRLDNYVATSFGLIVES